MDSTLAQKVNLILVGSTGQGKSTLGNFLMKPDLDHIWEENGQQRTFQVGEDRLSCTQHCAVSTSGDGSVTIMDTPGLNESHEKDLGYMINVVKNAHVLGSVHAVILVMKTESRMDQTYKDTVLYYQQLFGADIFAAHLVIVHPDFKESSKKYQDPSKIQKIMQQSAEDVQNLLGLKAAPSVRCLNSLPETVEELMKQLTERERILQHARANLAAAPLARLRVPKTPAVEAKHEKEKARLEERLAQLVEQKAQRMQIPSAAQEHFDWLRREIKKQTSEMERLNEDLAIHDTPDLVEVADTSRWVQTGRGIVFDFRLTSPVTIRKVTYCTWDTADYRETFRSDREVCGVFERGLGRYFHSGTLWVKAWGVKREYFAQAIATSKASLNEVKEHLRRAFDEKRSLETEFASSLDLPDVKNLEQQIAAVESEIKRLSELFFTSIEEAEREAQQMLKSKL
ncbi:IAN7 [Symbiodinium sp. CCMP2592]|nr:IAN7 [Symbiodinium sp. CCMP2592]